MLPPPPTPVSSMPFPGGIYYTCLADIQTYLFHTNFSILYVTLSTLAFSLNVSERLAYISTYTFSSFSLTVQNVLLHGCAITYLTGVRVVDAQLFPVCALKIRATDSRFADIPGPMHQSTGGPQKSSNPDHASGTTSSMKPSECLSFDGFGNCAQRGFVTHPMTLSSLIAE